MPCNRALKTRFPRVRRQQCSPKGMPRFAETLSGIKSAAHKRECEISGLAGNQVLHAGDALLPHGNTLITIVGNGANLRESRDSATHISEIKVPAGIVRAAGVAH